MYVYVYVYVCIFIVSNLTKKKCSSLVRYNKTPTNIQHLGRGKMIDNYTITVRFLVFRAQIAMAPKQCFCRLVLNVRI